MARISQCPNCCHCLDTELGLALHVDCLPLETGSLKHAIITRGKKLEENFGYRIVLATLWTGLYDQLCKAIRRVLHQEPSAGGSLVLLPNLDCTSNSACTFSST